MAFKRETQTTVLSSPGNPRLGIALAGGGSWGAATWGALTALLEHNIINNNNLSAISGTSAGAVNAAALSFAANSGDIKRAAAYLALFWSKIMDRGDSASLIMMQAGLGEIFPNLNKDAVEHGRRMTRLLQTWGLTSQPGAVGSAIESTLGRDWSAIHKGHVKTYIGTTEVGRDYNGQKKSTHKTFSNREITPKVIAASGTLIGTTTINGKEYEDGAFLRNPSLEEVVHSDATDILTIVLYPEPKGPITPLPEDKITPSKTGFIGDETYQALAWYKQNRPDKKFHTIGIDTGKAFPQLNETSKMNISREWLVHLYKQGYEQTKQWIAENAHKIGHESSFQPTIAAPAAPIRQIIHRPGNTLEVA